jgi:putative transposase
MPRGARVHVVDHPHHLIQRGIDRAACFSEPGDYAFYLGLLEELAPLFACEVHAYVLMTNHTHLLVTPRSEQGCSALMKHLGQRYVQRINKRWRRSGPLWEGRFKSCLVDTARYALVCQRYIELNPVRAGMVHHPEEYPWSSFRHNALGLPSKLLTPLDVYANLGDHAESRLLAYRSLFEEAESETQLGEIRSAARGGFALGSPDFVERMSSLVGRSIARRNRWPAMELPKKEAKRGLSPVR